MAQMLMVHFVLKIFIASTHPPAQMASVTALQVTNASSIPAVMVFLDALESAMVMMSIQSWNQNQMQALNSSMEVQPPPAHLYLLVTKTKSTLLDTLDW